MTFSHRNDSLTAVLYQQLRSCPNKTAVIVRDNSGKEIIIPCKSLLQKIKRYAFAIQEQGVRPGDTVVIALRHSPELIFTLLGAWFARAIPTLFPYKDFLFSGDSYYSQLISRLENARADWVITLDESTGMLQNKRGRTHTRCLWVEELKKNNIPAGHLPPEQAAGGKETAYIQYTSGTTGHNKGVLLSHHAAVKMLLSLGKLHHIGPKDVIVSWLPLYHDFGLFAGFLLPLVWNIPFILISPFAWLRNPELWLNAVHRHRGTITFTPNSGLEHTVKYFRPEKYQGVKLDSLRFLSIGAEPILPGSVNKFYKMFQPRGLRDSAICTGYGMAENTLAATVDLTAGKPHVDSIRITGEAGEERAEPAPLEDPKTMKNVSCGFPLPGVKLKILNQAGEALPERRIGEIAFHSPYLFNGYLGSNSSPNKPSPDSIHYYRSGDLGYIADGKLYVCGRQKDLIITGGRNFFAKDLESSLDSIPGVSPRSCIALGILEETRGTEKLVVIAGIQPGLKGDIQREIAHSIRRTLVQTFGVTAEEVHLVKPNWITKTRNGKISRTGARLKYEHWKSKGRFK